MRLCNGCLSTRKRMLNWCLMGMLGWRMKSTMIFTFRVSFWEKRWLTLMPWNVLSLRYGAR
ncbi:hypothetical protein Gotri_020913 [Gossypium trilobum]|uniref:Uncharacterized protein n=1 Tax=Gossypium trilobum TaxID=34281 RepID=A0A7J9DAV0_9ROSI|nr:hypothetical protein [Gossypium trilobum]